MNIGLPSGIGDISWAVSKLITSDEWGKLSIKIADGWPFRAQPYLDMLGIESSYGQFRYEDIIAFRTIHTHNTWREIYGTGFGTYLLEPNTHLEMGRPLHEYLPDLDTNYHYPLAVPKVETKRYYAILNAHPHIGISAASYRGATAWKTWEMEQWLEVCHMILKDGYKICLMGGSWDDLTRALEYDLPEGEFISLVGKTSFPEACAVHRLLPKYLGFSSGLGIIRSVMGLPTMMLWPHHQQPLSVSWADPDDIDSGKYIAFPYVQPATIFKLLKQQEVT